ncbi:MAG: 6,7-dimethyl-8-ribityllumazine synthase [Spirochaetales bacterium]|nr:6,7-dimethyl-8-ribityllumazine synthase [Spirochaetales bacterium]
MSISGIKEYTGDYSASTGNWAIVVSRFNSLITERLLEGAVDALIRHGSSKENMDIIRVPGAFELSWAAKQAALKKKYRGIICLGAVIRGDTPHFDMVANETTKGLASVSLDMGIPIGFGVLTTENIEQALERAGTKAGNKGFDAALTVMEMAQLQKVLNS